MKTQILRMAVAAAAILSMAVPLQAGGPASSVLHQPGDSTCGHVIDLLMHYGTSNHVNRVAVPFGNSLILGDSMGDLELVSVTLLDPGSDVAGPTVAIAVRNNSERAVTSFAVSAVAVLGRIHPFSPSRTSTIEKICAGETLEIQLQLPIEALAMGRAGRELLAFRKLVVAIDSFDELMECNESNNILVLDRMQIPVAVAPPVGEETAVAPETAPANPQLIPGESVPTPTESGPISSETAPTNPTDPTVNQSPTNIDDIDFDNWK